MHAKLQAALIILTLGAAAGCAPLKVSRTVALPGLPPVADAKTVEVVERLDDVKKPYQLVGKVTVWKAGSRLNPAESSGRICAQAARMGADGIIGLHTGYRGSLYSALAVKWLSPGEAPQPVQNPIVVALLPVATNPKAPGRHEKIANKLREGLDFMLEIKGYYPLQGWVAGADGGIDQAKQLDDRSLGLLGGDSAQGLLELKFVDSPTFHHYLIFASTHAKAKLTLLDKQTRSTAFEVSGIGGENTLPYFIVGGPIFSSLLPLFIIDPMRTDAGTLAAGYALQQIKPICEDVTP